MTFAPKAVDPAAGMLDSEGLGVVDASQPVRCLPVCQVSELEREGRHASRGDADVQAGAFAVVDLGPLGDPLLAQAIGQDDATPRLPAVSVVMVVSMWFRLLRLETKGLGFGAFSLSCGR